MDSVRHLIRSPRVRRTFVWACVPYLVLSLFADVLHVHPLPSMGAGAVGTVQHLASTSSQRPYPIRDTTCAICQWHRVGPRLQAATSVTPTTLAGPTLVVLVSTDFPKSPVPQSSALRGPPTPSFS